MKSPLSRNISLIRKNESFLLPFDCRFACFLLVPEDVKHPFFRRELVLPARAKVYESFLRFVVGKDFLALVVRHASDIHVLVVLVWVLLEEVAVCHGVHRPRECNSRIKSSPFSLLEFFLTNFHVPFLINLKSATA